MFHNFADLHNGNIFIKRRGQGQFSIRGWTVHHNFCNKTPSLTCSVAIETTDTLCYYCKIQTFISIINIIFLKWEEHHHVFFKQFGNYFSYYSQSLTMTLTITDVPNAKCIGATCKKSIVIKILQVRKATYRNLLSKSRKCYFNWHYWWWMLISLKFGFSPKWDTVISKITSLNVIILTQTLSDKYFSTQPPVMSNRQS